MESWGMGIAVEGVGDLFFLFQMMVATACGVCGPVGVEEWALSCSSVSIGSVFSKLAMDGAKDISPRVELPMDGANERSPMLDSCAEAATDIWSSSPATALTVV